MVYTAVLTKVPHGYDVTVPDVPGCVTYGETLEDAIVSAKDALCGCLCVYEDEDVGLPAVHLPSDVPVEEGSFAALLDVDLDEYRRQTDTRAVRKNVSIPAWMATQVDKRGINCSQLLQDAIKQVLA